MQYCLYKAHIVLRSLNYSFEHNIHNELLCLHGDIARAILVTKQIAINQGEPLFEVGHRDPPCEDEDGSTDSDL